MERKRIEKIVALLLVGILMPVSLFPFRIYADTITTNNIKGINTILLSKTQNKVSTNEFWYVYEHTITLDANYVGTINLNVNLTYYNPSGSSQTYGVTSLNNKDYYVNGNTIKVNQVCTSDNYGNQGPYVSSSYLLNSSNVIKYDDIESLQQVIDLLTDIYQNSENIEGLSTNQLAELENIVSGTSLANQYLDKISKLRELNISIESYNYIIPLLVNESREIIDYRNIYYLNYPVFRLNIGESITPSIYKNNFNPAKILFYVFTDFNGKFDKTVINTVRITSYDFNILTKLAISSGYLYLVELSNVEITSGYGRFEYNGSYNTKFIPIYLGNMNDKNISTDFALIFGLSNQLLDDIHIIAQGTSQSSSASGSLDQTTSQFSDDASDLVTIEESFNNSMNQSLQSVNPTFNMGSSFLTSANWVSQQFNRIVNNTPFASLITFGLTLGLGLLIIGKVRK